MKIVTFGDVREGGEGTLRLWFGSQAVVELAGARV